MKSPHCCCEGRLGALVKAPGAQLSVMVLASPASSRWAVADGALGPRGGAGRAAGHPAEVFVWTQRRGQACRRARSCRLCPVAGPASSLGHCRLSDWCCVQTMCRLSRGSILCSVALHFQGSLGPALRLPWKVALGLHTLRCPQECGLRRLVVERALGAEPAGCRAVCQPRGPPEPSGLCSAILSDSGGGEPDGLG